MRIMEERGVYRRLILYWEARRPICLQNSIIEADSVELTEFYPAFVLLLIGIINSLLILLIEIYMRKRYQRKLYPYVN